jgi:hypothetical protein
MGDAQQRAQAATQRPIRCAEELAQHTIRQLQGLMRYADQEPASTKEACIAALISSKVLIPRKFGTRELLGFVHASTANRKAATRQIRMVKRHKVVVARANAAVADGTMLYDANVHCATEIPIVECGHRQSSPKRRARNRKQAVATANAAMIAGTFRHYAGATTDEDTGAKLVWRKLTHPNNPDRDRWVKATAEEWARLIDETETLEFINPGQKEAHRLASYMSMATSLKPDADGNLTVARVRGSYGGNCTDYTGLRQANTASMAAVKTLMNAVVSDPTAKCMCADAKNFYLMTVLDKYEYMWIDRAQIPDATFVKYNLDSKQTNSKGQYMVRVKRGMYGLPHAGRLAMIKVTKLLAKAGYHECKLNKMVFRHATKAIVFTLVVDDFMVKYTNREDAEDLMRTLEEVYVMKTDWAAEKYLGITRDWKYTSAVRSVRLSMPNYIAKGVAKFSDWLGAERKTAHGPGVPAHIIYGQQQAKQADESAELPKAEKTMLQSFVGYFRYYAEAIDSTQLVKLGQLGAQQSRPTEATKAEARTFLDYVNTWPNAAIVFHASDMILRCVSDGSHRGEPEGGSRVAGFHYYGSAGSSAINGAVQILCRLLNVQSSSACETELGALYENGRINAALRTLVGEMGHWQSGPTEFECDNKCAVGIACGTEKQKRAAAMDMRFLWFADRVRQGQIVVAWQKGDGNLADFFTKIHTHKHHRAMRKMFVEDSQGFSARKHNAQIKNML